MNELALFAGAGGGILGGRLLGWRTVCAVEREPAAQRMLLARQDDGCLEPFPIWDDVCTFDGKPWRGVVDIVTGGFPCQDISAAGKGEGITGERSGLWKEMARIICEVGPRFVLVENSPVLTSRGLGVVLGDLAAMGYDARWGVLGAVHAGAPHKRERIWILAHDPQHGRRTGWARRSDPSSQGQPEQSLSAVADSGGGRCGEPRSRKNKFKGGAEAIRASETLADTDTQRCSRSGVSACEREPLLYATGSSRSDETSAAGDGREAEDDLADTEPERLQGLRPDARQSEIPESGEDGSEVSDAPDTEPERRRDRSGWRSWSPSDDDGAGTEGTDWWLTEPDVGRVAHGVAARVDRLRALGNGQVPAVAALAWQTLTSDL
jgi:DNA (cytosine-5)-methyltransferase 1